MLHCDSLISDLAYFDLLGNRWFLAWQYRQGGGGIASFMSSASTAASSGYSSCTFKRLRRGVLLGLGYRLSLGNLLLEGRPACRTSGQSACSCRPTSKATRGAARETDTGDSLLVGSRQQLLTPPGCLGRQPILSRGVASVVSSGICGSRTPLKPFKTASVRLSCPPVIRRQFRVSVSVVIASLKKTATRAVVMHRCLDYESPASSSGPIYRSK